jgi:hypothetical protein
VNEKRRSSVNEVGWNDCSYADGARPCGIVDAIAVQIPSMTETRMKNCTDAI